MTADRSLLRRSAGAAALTAGVAGAVAYHAATVWHGSPFAVAVAAALGLSAFGFTRRSLLVQTASRGAIYLVAAPLLLGVGSRIITGSTVAPAHAAALVASFAALWLARPMLHTEGAHRAFAPARFRSAFLAGATAVMTAATAAVAYAAVGVAIHSSIQVVFNAVLALVLVVAVRALLAMRTWGLLLGGVTSLALLAVAPFHGSVNAATLSLAAAPALLLWVIPLVLARNTRRTDAFEVTSPRFRVDAGPEAAHDAREADLEEEPASGRRALVFPARVSGRE